MGSWTFSLVILSNVSVLACDDINFFVVVVGGWKWRSLAIVEVVAFQMGHAVPVSRYFVLLPLAVLSENP